MKFQILTLFPQAFDSFKTTSIIGRAVESKKIEIEVFDIRQFTTDKHKKVDDVPFGGGAGLLMTCQPLFDCIEHVQSLSESKAPVIFFSPHGKVWNQRLAESFAAYPTEKNIDRVILLCGHYEGIDQRVIDELVDEQISLGSYVLTGGELPAQIFIDSVARLLPGVIGKEVSHQEESFSLALDGKLEYPQYTRPSDFRGLKVPEVLLSGHHAKIEQWKKDNCQNPE
ncbi:tRNA (guanosine(37)-N1)-methyltransferase TrmD [bacterium DOLZORAL124_38_8]|nr:MAG: tRNA (guanosine(37)-N1)-methyltransferase TrmD [bacterium DOLZORAL124_38_8]